MIGGESFGHTGKLLAMHIAEEEAHGGGAHDPAKFPVPLSHVPADCPQRFRRRHVDAAAHRELLVRYREVVARAFRAAPARKAGRDAVLIRRFVLAETRVAVETVD